MEEQKETRPQEQERAQGEQMCCPVCGRPMWPRREPWGMRRMGPWGYRGMGPMGPWGGRYHHPGHWVHQPISMVWTGVVPALLGFVLGYLVASARLSAMYAFVGEEKRKR